MIARFSLVPLSNDTNSAQLQQFLFVLGIRDLPQIFAEYYKAEKPRLNHKRQHAIIKIRLIAYRETIVWSPSDKNSVCINTREQRLGA